MTNSRTFGRREGFASTPAHRASVAQASPQPQAEPSPAEPPVEDEVQAWSRERRRQHGFRVPWTQLSLVASLSFFIASFVLPRTVNDAVDWVLDLLAAASFWVWFVGRRGPKAR